MSKISDKISLYQMKVLDLSGRNRLVKYHPTKSGSFSLKDDYPNLYDLYDTFVNEGIDIVYKTQFSVYYDNEDYQDSLLFQDEDDHNTLIQNEEINIRDRTKRLESTRKKIRDAERELGYNIGYIAFGFIKWYESESVDSPTLSPLLLVPITITRRSKFDPFIISYNSSEEINLNYTVLKKLEDEFGIKMQEFSAYDYNDKNKTTIKLADVFNWVEQNVINNNSKWGIEQDAYIDVFSYQTQAIYNDLIKNINLIESSDLIKALCDDGVIEVNQTDIENIYKTIDNHPSAYNLQILDADSSQQIALRMARAGYSFVIQGPPGTGKSQTIINIIAESIGTGKKVLFVSEKQAALDIVFDKLNKYGLSDFVLQMHNNKQSKSDIRTQLQNAVDKSSVKISLNQAADLDLKRLDLCRDELNQYITQLHNAINPLCKNAFSAYSELSRLNKIVNIPFQIKNITNIDQEYYNSLLIMIDEYAKSLGETSFGHKKNIWKYLKKAFLSNDEKTTIQTVIDNLLSYFYNLDKLNLDLMEIIGVYNYIDVSVSDYDYSTFDDIIKHLESIPQYSFSDLNRLLMDDSLNIVIIYFSNIIEVNKKIIHLMNSLNIVPDTVIALTNLKEMIDFLKQYPYITIEGTTIKENLPIAILINDLNELISSANIILDEHGVSANNINQISNDITTVNERISKCHGVFAKCSKIYKTDRNFIKKHLNNTKVKINHKALLSISNALNSFYEAKHLLYSVADKMGIMVNNLHDVKMIEDIYYSNREKIKRIGLIRDFIDNLNEYKRCTNTLPDILHKYLNRNISIDSLELINILKYIIWLLNLDKHISLLDSNIGNTMKSVLSNPNNPLVLNEIINLFKTIKNTIIFIKSEFSNLNNIFNLDGLSTLKNINTFVNEIDFNNLSQWSFYASCRDILLKNNLDNFVEMIEHDEYYSKDIIFIFKKRFWYLWLDAYAYAMPQIIKFSSEHQKQLVDNFKLLDKKQLEIARVRVRAFLTNNMPNFSLAFNSKQTETGILLNELKKKRNLLSTRKLIESLPNILPAIKPCMMMSPLTVSTYFGTNTKWKFDLVIFDEASQIKPEFAVSAIARGKQLIVAGDSQQMPPTYFFDSFYGNSDEYNDEAQEEIKDDLESILDEMAMRLPDTELRWHYRSRDESLIAFSNINFYGNRLFTFPSTKNHRKGTTKVKFHYVENGLFINRQNEKEAEEVVKLVFNHFKDYPKLSLGVVTFGLGQSQLIEKKVQQLRNNNIQYEEYFNEDKNEEFFVKNLENVQGDERDVIILSIGYAPKQVGEKLLMSFGPLSREGGERRLNVAVSRSKQLLIVVSSIHASDITGTDTENVPKGRKLLKDYIDYAEHGYSALLGENDIMNYDSPVFDSDFELSVYEFLIKEGWKVRTQVGASGYRIDLCVLHPNIEGRYILAVECDGAQYHSSLTARDRDRLRQEILENLGWTFHRIWSTSWIKNRKNEEQKLLDALNSAINNYGFKDATDKKKQDMNRSNIEINSLSKEDQRENVIDFMDAFKDIRNRIPKYAYKNGNYDPYLIPDNIIEECIMFIVQQSSPIDIETLYHTVAKAAFFKFKLSFLMRCFIENVLNNMVEKGKITINNNIVQLIASKNSS